MTCPRSCPWALRFDGPSKDGGVRSDGVKCGPALGPDVSVIGPFTRSKGFARPEQRTEECDHMGNRNLKYKEVRWLRGSEIVLRHSPRCSGVLPYLNPRGPG